MQPSCTELLVCDEEISQRQKNVPRKHKDLLVLEKSCIIAPELTLLVYMHPKYGAYESRTQEAEVISQTGASRKSKEE